MITIHKSKLAESRTADGKNDSTDLAKSTRSHIKDVKEAMGFIADTLKERSKNHDHTKLENIDAFTDALNSGNIKDTEWYKFHITKERHHLKSNIPENVNIIDVIEHICDCTMAGLARSGTVYDTDIDPDVLVLAVQNTVKILINHTEVLDDEHEDHFGEINDSNNDLLDQPVEEE